MTDDNINTFFFCKWTFFLHLSRTSSTKWHLVNGTWFYGRVMRDVEPFTQYIIQYPEFKTMLGLGASHMRS